MGLEFDAVGSGVDRDSLFKYIEEQIYSLPGIDRHQDKFTILLTGSRATGTHKPQSDVDIDVLCPQTVYDAVHKASLETGIIQSPTSFFRKVPFEVRHSYFGDICEEPHFSLTSLENVKDRFEEYDDVALWIWTNAMVITDPGEQFEKIRRTFRGYPKDVLVRKIKYHWLLAGYWAVDGYPGCHTDDIDVLAAASSVMHCLNENLKVFYLVDSRPFPYMEKLMHFAGTTSLGREWCPLFQKNVNLAIGNTELKLDVWERLDRAINPFRHQDPGTVGERYWLACEKALVAAGVESEWIAADYDNVDELLIGSLGPPP